MSWDSHMSWGAPFLTWRQPLPMVVVPAPIMNGWPQQFRSELAQTGLLTAAELDALMQSPREAGESVVRACVKSGMVAEEKLLQALAKSLHLKFTRLGEDEMDSSVRERVPTKAVFQYNVMPMRMENGCLLVATDDPFNLPMVECLRMASKSRIRLALSPRADIQKSLKRYYGVGAETLDELLQKNVVDLDMAAATIAKQDVASDDQEASVVKFVNQIIAEAYKERSTDIHLEPMENDLRIRYRVDGALHQVPVPAQLKRFQAAIISRIKVMANMDIAERRLPQDGRINVRSSGAEIDVRVSTIPTPYGESVSLRLLTRNSIFLGLDKLGLYDADAKLVRKLVELPHGIILVTGPTGSGKSTSLYAFLSTINSIDQRIITIEEPIEYELPGVNQMQVKSEIGLTFASGLRHILRQDPDVIMVGEIRDLETAEIAIRAALTGHLVFSTLHTNDAAGAVTRLLDMGIEPFLVSSSVEAIIAQRLVRTLCPSCKTAYTPDPDLLKEVGYPMQHDSTTFYRARGCEECRFTGFRGRMGIYEILVMHENLRPLIIERAASSAIKQAACAGGMKTLRDDGWAKVRAGLTTVEEVARVTHEDEALAAS